MGSALSPCFPPGRAARLDLYALWRESPGERSTAGKTLNDLELDYNPID